MGYLVLIGKGGFRKQRWEGKFKEHYTNSGVTNSTFLLLWTWPMFQVRYLLCS